MAKKKEPELSVKDLEEEIADAKARGDTESVKLWTEVLRRYRAATEPPPPLREQTPFYFGGKKGRKK